MPAPPSDEIGTVGADDPDDSRTFEWDVLTGTSEDDLARQDQLAWYSQLAKIRSQHKALRTGSVNPVDCSSSNKKPSACNGGSNCPTAHLADVTVGNWFHLAADYVVNNGMMVGTTDTTFSPDTTTSRAMIVTILWNLEGKPQATGILSFADVAENAWYAHAVNWAAENGIVAGYSNDTFGPDDSITREQMAAILMAYAKFKGYDLSVGEDTNILSYEDTFSISEWAIPAMQWACGSGLISGRGADMLAPAAYASRAEAAVILKAFCENVIQ